MEDVSSTRVRELLARGLSSTEVVAELGVAPATVAAVKAHMTMGTYGSERSGSAGIYLRHADELIALAEQPYETEDVLQALVARHPGLLAGEELSETPRRWVLLSREVGVGDYEGASGRWSLDHLFVDQDATPTLVEVKRSSDTRIRREVVGQLLEYAANGTRYWLTDQLRTVYEAACNARDVDPDAELRDVLGQETDVDDWWAQVETNLRLGRLRLVFVADQITRELRRIIEFLNEQMTQTEVVGVEIRQYVDTTGKHQTLVPRVIGQTEAARDLKGASSGRSRRRWGEDDVLKAIREAQPPALADRMIRLYESLRDAEARASWGTGAKPSVTMWLGESEDNPVSVSFYTEGVAINFDFVRDTRTPEEMARLARLVREVPGVASYIEGLEEQNWGMHRGMRPEHVLPTDEALSAFERALLEASQRPEQIGT